MQDMPVRWCPNPRCNAPSNIHAAEWAQLDADHEPVICGNCCICRASILWEKVKPR